MWRCRFTVPRRSYANEDLISTRAHGLLTPSVKISDRTVGKLGSKDIWNPPACISQKLRRLNAFSAAFSWRRSCFTLICYCAMRAYLRKKVECRITGVELNRCAVEHRFLIFRFCPSQFAESRDSTLDLRRESNSPHKVIKPRVLAKGC